MRRKSPVAALVAAAMLMPAMLVPVARAAEPVAPLPVVKVWKTPTCGCCGKWVRHMEDAGFRVDVTDLDSVDAIRAEHGVPPRLASCHTATVGGYVVEGHVPASDVRRLLAEKPDALGLTAPGMPAGSPGMDVPSSPPYDVLQINKDASTTVYATHR